MAKSHHKNNIIIKRYLGMGDCAFAASAATALKRQNPYLNIWFDAPKGRLEWLNTCPVFETGIPPDNAVVFDLDAIEIDSHEDRSFLMARALGLDSFTGAELTLNIDFNPGWGRFLCFVPYCAGYAKTRSLMSSEVGRFLRLLENPVVLMYGHKISVFEPEKGIVASFQTTEYEAVRIALSCRAVVGMDSGIPHVAALCGKRTVMAFTHIQPQSRTKFVGKHLTVIRPSQIADDCPCGEYLKQPPCYGTVHFANCAKSINAEALIAALDVDASRQTCHRTIGPRS